MTFGFCHLSIVPLREEASDSSQMISQLLFGDVFEVLEHVSDNWIKIRNAYDAYEGYMDPKQAIPIDSIDYVTYQEVKYNNDSPMEISSSFGKQLLPSACSFPGDIFKIYDFQFNIEKNMIVFQQAGREQMIATAKSFLNAPYLWGGKTVYGIDCSGFTQMVYKISGVKIKRDASQQAQEGEMLNFLEEARAGDLAFFDNEEGNITHVGILVSDSQVIHASGCVRMDKIDHHGIYHQELGKYTHRLRFIKRLLS